MNMNSALQKPITYEYRKQKYTKKNNNNKFNKRSSIYSIITIVLILISSYYITHDFYVSSNSCDLYFAVEYSFTNNKDEKNSLLRVQNMNLISSDGTNAIVEVSGLSKSSPHYTIFLKGRFVKDNNNCWYLKEILYDNL